MPQVQYSSSSRPTSRASLVRSKYSTFVFDEARPRFELLYLVTGRACMFDIGQIAVKGEDGTKRR